MSKQKTEPVMTIVDLAEYLKLSTSIPDDVVASESPDVTDEATESDVESDEEIVTVGEESES